MLYLCTYFDRHFLPRALALYESLRRHCAGDFHLFALCLEAESEEMESFEIVQGLQLEHVEAVALSQLERFDPELCQAKQNRSLVEYYFTCSPCLPLYLFHQHPEIDRLTYLDADLFFYSDPGPLYDELGSASIGMTAHRFSSRVADRAQFGNYNVGWLVFRRDENALACLRWWRERCLEWCFTRLEENRYADQKYLDQWPERFAGVRVVEHKGANLGPWNLANHRITERKDRLWVGDQPLVFFHFSSFLPVGSWLYNTNLASWHVRPSAVVRRKVIGPYIESLRRQRYPGPGGAPSPPRTPRPAEGGGARLRRKLRAVMRICGGLVAQDHLVVVRGRVL